MCPFTDSEALVTHTLTEYMDECSLDGGEESGQSEVGYSRGEFRYKSCIIEITSAILH